MNNLLEILQPSQILYSKRKTISLIIKPGGEFIVRSPKNVAERRIFEFIQKKQDWIIKTREKLALKVVEKHRFEAKDGDIIPFLDSQIHLTYNPNQVKNCIFDPINLLLSVNTVDQTLSKKIVLDWLAKQARLILSEELKFWSQTMKLNPSKFRLSSAKTRWGSCSGKNTISLNWRLILTPKKVLQYVVIHEIAHIKQKNHSQHFWNLVLEFDQNFKEHRKYLKIKGGELIGRFS
jgi:predicted metal-dependent hydrolase